MVEHQGAVGLRGRMFIATQHRKDAGSDTSAQAEVSYLYPTSLRPTPLKSTHLLQLEIASKSYCMETCDMIYCRLQPHADLLLPNGRPDRLHPTTTYEAMGLVLFFGAHLGRYWVCGRTYPRRRRHANDRPSLGPSQSSTFSRIRLRSTCLDQRDHKQCDALPTGCSSAA
eukprot:1459267-Pyramimonas_sp.AAC.1